MDLKFFCLRSNLSTLIVLCQKRESRYTHPCLIVVSKDE